MKKYYIIALCVLHFGNLYNVYPCGEAFLKAWKVSSEDCERCIKLEEKIEKEKGNIRDLFKAVDGSLVGSLNYTMSWDEINKKITDVFTQMRKDGRIVTEKEFEKNKDEYYIIQRDPALSRIWGADYLKNAISQDPLLSDYSVPDYIIVVRDLKNVEIIIDFFGRNAPVVETVRSNGTKPNIYFKKISGENVTSSSNVLKKIGYNDFLGENVILDKGSKKRYIIDTELASFDLKKFNNLVSKDFTGLGKDCQELYIKKLLYNEYGLDFISGFAIESVLLDLSSIKVFSKNKGESVDMLAQAFNSLVVY